MTDGQRERQRETERETEKDRERDRERQRETERETDRKNIKIIKTCLHLTHIIARNFVKVCEDFSVDNADL